MAKISSLCAPTDAERGNDPEKVRDASSARLTTAWKIMAERRRFEKTTPVRQQVLKETRHDAGREMLMDGVGGHWKRKLRASASQEHDSFRHQVLRGTRHDARRTCKETVRKEQK
eukprot:986683-Pyramimonas_sp.AAC.1